MREIGGQTIWSTADVCRSLGLSLGGLRVRIKAGRVPPADFRLGRENAWSDFGRFGRLVLLTGSQERATELILQERKARCEVAA